eukprot:NODE_1294_length_1410_cov_0.981693.p1 type:complete len:185 gc:universal NODE_1294_length_1410_cov_0.981693:967-413(-)
MDSERLSPIELLNVSGSDSIKGKYLSQQELEYVNEVIIEKISVIQTLRVLKYVRKITSTSKRNGKTTQIFKIGDRVLYWMDKRPNKMSNKATGPFVIVKLDDNYVTIKNENDGNLISTTTSMIKRLGLSSVMTRGMSRSGSGVITNDRPPFPELFGPDDEHVLDDQHVIKGIKWVENPQDSSKS